MTDRTEALREEIARIAAPMMEGGREFDQCPPDRIALRKWNREGMCSINDATQDDALTLADALLPIITRERERAARAALDAAGDRIADFQKPVRDSLAACEHALEMSVARERRTAEQVKAEQRRFQEFAAQCDIIDERGARIVIDFDAIERLEKSAEELRVRISSRSRVDLCVSELVDLRRDITIDRDNLVTLIGARVAQQFAIYLTKKGWRA